MDFNRDLILTRLRSQSWMFVILGLVWRKGTKASWPLYSRLGPKRSSAICVPLSHGSRQSRHFKLT